MASFEQSIWKNLSLRKKEIIDLHLQSLLTDNVSQGRHNFYLRSFVVMLYAHWEGFIKYACQQYVKEIAKEKLTCKKLNPNLFSFYMNAQYIDKQQGQNSDKLVDMFCNLEIEKFTMDFSNKISTSSKLDTDVFLRLTKQLGLPNLNIELHRGFINETLVGNRNKIAHGELGVNWTTEDSKTYKDIVINLIEDFAESIINHYEDKKYLVDKTSTYRETSFNNLIPSNSIASSYSTYY